MSVQEISALIQQIVSGIESLGTLFTTGQRILSSIMDVIKAHPLIAAAAAITALVIYLPDIISTIANWIARLRLSWNRLNKSVRLPVEQLEIKLGLKPIGFKCF